MYKAAYRYFGCIINQHVESRAMVYSRAKVGATALAVCMVEELQDKCMLGGKKRGVICKLLEALVGSVLLYGAEVWRCCRQMGPLEQVQMLAATICLGLGH